MARAPTPNPLLALCVLLAACVLGASAAGTPARIDLGDTTRLRVGIGDRVTLRRGDQWRSSVQELDRLELDVDLLQLWLPRGWKPDWVSPSDLREIARRGITPVVVHYYFGDDISKERVEAQREGWYSSMWEMAQRIRMDSPVLVVLEPEFNHDPPPGETAITRWPGFAEDLRAAAKMIRREAPNALVGACPGDFAGPPRLEAVLGPAAEDLDFIAFQEMRASTHPERKPGDSMKIASSALSYARYLKRAFNRPILFGYLAVSSYDGWEGAQAAALRDVLAHREALREAGVFGLVYFQLYDDPEHKGYFGPAERHFGLLTAAGRPKPALEAFRALLR